MSPVPENRRARVTETGEWVRRSMPSEQPPTHTCLPPVTSRTYRVRPLGAWPSHLGPPPDVQRSDQPDGEAGDLWRCRCGRLWQVMADPVGMVPGGRFTGLRWQPASLWTQFLYARHPATPASKPPAPPSGPSGVSASADGSR